MFFIPVAIVLGAVSGCGGAAGPTLTAAPQSTIPSSFTTYTDEEQLFSISYPSEWELALSDIPQIETSTRALLELMQSDVPPKVNRLIFVARIPGWQVGDVAVGINISSLPEGVSTFEQLGEAGVEELKEAGVREYEQFSEVEAVVGSKKGIIVDHEFTIPDQPRFRAIQMAVLDGKVIWTVGCTAFPEKLPPVEETCNQVVRSLRILR